MNIKPLKKPEDNEKRRRNRNLIIGAVLILLMILSTVGYAILEGNVNESQKNKYNGYEFTTNTGGYWQTKIKLSGQEKTIQTYFLPKDVENISYTGNILLSDFDGKTIYYVSNNYGSENNAISALDTELRNYYLRAQSTCSPENENLSFCQNLPIKSCDDASSQTMIIKINDITNSTPSISYKNYCLAISGSGIDLTKAVDKIIFKIYGVMN